MSEDRFSTLDRELPLLLFPVRLEARYLPRKSPTHLHVRIFPDVIHAAGHRRWLSEREAEAGKRYWTSIWGTQDAALITEARRWLVAQTGPHRALWVATTTRPTNLGTADAAPLFPALPIEAKSEPVRAALLPDEWMVRLYDRDLVLRYTTFTAPVTPDLPVAPALSAAGADAKHPLTGEDLAAPLAFLAGQDLLWTVDFELAEKVGMAVRIPIADVPKPVGALLVLGVRAGRDPKAEGALLDELLEAHWYSRGLDLVPQGTPTNNTDAGRTTVSLSSPDIDALFEREESTRALPPAGRALLMAADPALLYRLPAADSTSLAFGRVQTNTLDRTAHADWAEGAAAWAMNVATGYGILGRYLGEPLALVDGSVVFGQHTATLRDHFVDWVRGGSLLPVLRCGEQPYGVLPITHRPALHYGDAGFDVKYEHYLAKLLETWSASLPAAALDPDATDGMVGGTPTLDAAVIAEVLGAVPHPTALQLRGATDHVQEDAERLRELLDEVQTHANGDNLLDPAHDSLILAAWNNHKRWIGGLPDEQPPVPPPNVSTQLANLGFFRQEVVRAMGLATYPTTGPTILRLIDEEIQPLLEMRKEAVDAIPEVLWDWRAGCGVGAPDTIRLVATTFDDAVEPVHDLVTSSGDVAEIRAIIERAIGLLDAAEAGSIPPPQRERLVTSPAPLLTHLLDLNIRTVKVADIGPVRTALKILLALIDSPQVQDPIAELERLMRECLGVAMYRIDAWITAIAARRLAERRRARPFGAQIGGYGWLLDLKKSNDPASQGFIHAPSLPHAQSAAVLRSGWSAYGTASGETPLSIDLSAERVRGGQWILDGVRNGQDLAELLGARFERYLHDAKVDDWIEIVRTEALAARGETRPPTRIVDGLLVARAASDVEHTSLEAALATALGARLKLGSDPRENARKEKVRAALDRVAADLDAVADLTMMEAVHQLLQDNPEAAAAALAVTGGGDGAVPPISSTRTQRAAQLVSHRVVAMWPASPQTGPAASVLLAAEPRLVPWLEQLLPDPARVIAGVTVRDDGGAVVATDVIRLAALGLSALEAALLAGSAATQDGSRHGRALAAATRARHGDHATVDLSATAALDDSSVSVNEFGLLASALLEALGRARPLQASDLVLPGTNPATADPDVAEITSRIADTEALLLQLIGELAALEPARRAAALLRSATLGVTGAIRALEAGSTPEAAAAVAAALKARLEQPAEEPAKASSTRTSGGTRLPTSPLPGKPVPGPIEPPPPPPAALAERAAARLRHLTGGLVPILPVFTPPPDADRAASAGSTERKAQIATRGHAWLRQAGRVRPDLAAMVDFLLLAESVAGRATGPYGLAQLPHAADAWAAVAEPADDADRLCIVSLTGPQPLALDAQPVAGLLFDSWTEGIPRKRQQTGVAVHFDAPSARPPQSVLLSVVDDERGFSADDLCDQLLFTIELAKLRALGPMDLKEIGHYVPAVFVPDDVVVSGGAS